MAVIYRTDGAWGSGKGSNLSPAEVDGNFYDIDTRVTSIEDNPVDPVVPTAINIEGSAFTMGLSNGDTLGPIAITMPMPTWRGPWNATVAYNELDFFTAPDGGLGAVMIPHTSGLTFDWGELDGDTGLPLYRQLIGGSGTTSGISDLVDVALGTQADKDMLVWDGSASLWRNQTPLVVNTNLPAFTGSTGSAAGLKGLVPAPAIGDAAAGKVLGAGGTWIVPAGGSGGSTSLAGLTDVSISSPANLSLLQYQSSDGKWHNATLAALGAGTVTSVSSGTGLTGGPITGSGTLSLAQIGTLELLANVGGVSASPAGTTLSALLDAAIGSARGSILRRGASAWSVLTPGTSGTYLKSGGSGADLSWDSPAGSGTVTSVATSGGITGGPITGSGTLSLAPVATARLLANVSGSSAAPSETTVSAFLDATLGSSRGMILYRGASAWAALSPGTAGQVLTTGGASANPTWATGGGGSGDVVGPGSAVSGNVATYSGTTGKLIADGGASIADLKKQAIQVAVSDETTNLTTGTAKLTFRMPWAMTLTEVRSSLSVASSSGLVTVDIKESGTTIFSTALSIDATEKTSTTAATPAVLSDTALADDAEITVDITAAGTGAKGLKVSLLGTA